jgi:hypothetical protein
MFPEVSTDITHLETSYENEAWHKILLHVINHSEMFQDVGMLEGKWQIWMRFVIKFLKEEISEILDIIQFTNCR